MTGFLIFIVLPMALIAASFFIKPLVQRDKRHGDPFGENLAAGGMFGSHGLEQDERPVREETESVRFNLDDVKERE